jgi:hypothetical protein
MVPTEYGVVGLGAHNVDEVSWREGAVVVKDVMSVVFIGVETHTSEAFVEFSTGVDLLGLGVC